jgi:uncharacterized protein (TIGR00156 family)
MAGLIRISIRSWFGVNFPVPYHHAVYPLHREIPMNHFAKLIVVAALAAGSTAALAQNTGYAGPSALGAGGASATYKGPSGIPGMTVKQLLETGVDDQYVTLTGKLVRHTGGKNYDFADASAEIQAEISPKYFPPNQPIDANTLVRITGKFDKSHFGTSEVEVNQIVVLPK